MGKKGKVGKQRKDNYYKLAKAKGFRSRAAFKLIQLNRKFQFLENSRVCVDLCAAPGGWLQVASEYMPVSSVIIGVDLAPITPIRNVITFQGDITTPECSKMIENNLSNWKADVFLNDGAPNVGKNWLHDAYSQNVLVVHALKIACSHLTKGGWFITKIFRSADYNSLVWVFGKLFEKVHATKPQASRQESAEIFVVCQGYKKPTDIDARFFDPSSLFADISDFDDALKKQKADLLKPASKIKRAKARGYEAVDILKTVNDVDFVASNVHMDYLAQCHEIKLQSDDIIKHESTTEEIKECCKDLKVLGRKDLLKLLKWRRDLRKDLIAKLMKSLKENSSQDSGVDDEDDDNIDQMTIRSDDEDEEAEPELQLEDIEAQESEEKKKEMKRIKRKEEKRTKDYQQRVNYGMVNHGDVLIEEEHDLFNLQSISGKSCLKSIDDVEPDETLEQTIDPDDVALAKSKQKKTVSFSRETDVQYFELDGDYDEDEETHPADDEEGYVKHIESKIATPGAIPKNKSANALLNRLSSNSGVGGGLLTDLMDVTQSKISAATKFFDKKTFADIDLEKELETDIVDKITQSKLNRIESKKSEPGESDSTMSDSDIEVVPMDEDEVSDMDEDADDQPKKKHIKLDPQGLALASMMVSSAKTKREIEDEGWNRFAHADSHLAPKWFREEEEKYCRRNVPVSQELIGEYRRKIREIDAKPIKKVMQAKARQKRRAMRKMEKVKKKVEAITTNDDMTQREKINQIKTVYKNATKTKKKEVKLVVARKGLPAKKPTKGKYKMVDSRMKKDLKAKARRENKGKKGKSSGAMRGGGGKRKRKSNNSFDSKSHRKSSKGGARSRKK